MSRPPQPSICLPNKAVNNSGLTLIECLVAIAVIGLTAAVMAPVMVFSMATRIQSQRAEQALQIAQGEVDQIRLMAERGGDFSSALAAYPITSSPVALTSTPTAATDSLNSSSTPKTAKRVNISTTNQFAVQVYRSVGSTPSTTTGSTLPITFDVGVRVYDLKAVEKYGSTSSLRKDAASLSFTSGEGQRSTRPLAVIYTSIFQGDRDGALCTYRQYLGNAASTTGLDCN